MTGQEPPTDPEPGADREPPTDSEPGADSESPTGPIKTAEDVETKEEVHRPRLAKFCRQFAIPIVVFWVLVAIVVNVFVPSIEANTAANAKSLVPRDSPSSQAALVQGEAFRESAYTSGIVILFETEGRKLEDQDRQYYHEVVRRLEDDKEHVQSLLDLWASRSRSRGSIAPTPRPLP